ncbi:hypothetical protein WME99_05750 [Sorangium sp. So ce136]|uniref:hypothetical protein n=1 Tax=Sorangium sp. So ce136 TaxID=3133284 RepID=UPI003F027F5D
MGSEFLREAQVLHFGPRAHVEAAHRAPLLWPAWAYRVVAPEIQERQLNVLQKAALGLCRAGITGAEAIGRRLHLHRDLAGFILLELGERGYLRRDGLPTEDGLAVLVEETLEAQRTVAGHVFQDPWSGELWPRFITGLSYAETEPGANGFPVLILGTSGSPQRLRPHVETPDDLPPQRPEPKDILRAARRHRSALRGQSEPSFSGSDRGAEEPGWPAIMDRVSMLEDAPRPVLLSTYVYFPKNLDEGMDWYACDPFGLGASPALRRAIERRMPRSPRLQGHIERVLQQSIGANLGEHRAFVEGIRQKAALSLEAELPARALSSPAVYERLLELKQAADEANALGESCPEYKLRGVLVAARTSVEEVFLAIARTHPTSGVWRPLYADGRPASDRAYVRGIYEAAAHVAKFTTPIPAGLAGAKPNQVRWAADSRDASSLRAMIVAALLRARDDADHPLRSAAQAAPNLLVELEEIAQAGGRGAHAGEVPVSAELARDTTTRVWQLVTLLYGGRECRAPSV